MNAIVSTCINNIRRYAKAKDINLGQLETAAGYTAGYLSRIEKKDNISFKTVNAFAEKLGITADMLFAEKLESDIAAELINSKDFSNITIAKTEKGYSIYVQNGNKRVPAAECADLESAVETFNDMICRKEC